ncbi:YrhB domain-containing protein [Dyella sp.]|uniref:YrhB domain-containing protein n=1 Tax=Dyella sp. TaxID=1869338 RepID=UPI0032169061
MDPLDFHAAEALARAEVNRLGEGVGTEFGLMTDRTLAVESGWVFFFNTVEFIETGNRSAALAGNGPIYITTSGVLHRLPSATPWEAALKELQDQAT